MISFCLNVIIVIGYFGHCSHLEMSVQLCISTVTLQQQSSQKMYEGCDKLYPFLFHYCYISPTVTHGSVPCGIPYFPLPYCTKECRGCSFGPQLSGDWVKSGRSCAITVNFLWNTGTMEGAAEEALQYDDVITRQCFSASCFSSPQFSSTCCHHPSKFVCSIFPFKSTLLFFPLSPIPLSALQFLPIIQPWALWRLCSPLPALGRGISLLLSAAVVEFLPSGW